MQFIKCRADQLAALGKPLNHEDLINKILDGLDDDYKTIVDIVQTVRLQFSLMNYMKN